MKLYEATESLAIVGDWMDEHADELAASGGEIPEALSALLEQSEGDFTEKVERVALYIRELQADAEAVGDEADRLRARKASLERGIDGLKAYLRLNLEQANRPKVKTPLVTVSLAKNSKPTMTETPDPGTLPDEFVTIIPPKPAERRINTDALVAAFKEGKPLPSGVAFEVRHHIRIS